MRKWVPIYCGGMAVKIGNNFDIDTKKMLPPNKSFIRLKSLAMNKKKEYILNKIGSKEEFLNKFSESNKSFNSYNILSMDDYSYKYITNVNIDMMRSIRIENAKIIFDMLNKNKNIIKLVHFNVDEDCPLFIPVILKNIDINKLRQRLIDHKIYCPIHWPRSQMITNNASNDIYYNELSLVCDQRYKKNDIIKYINTFLNIVEELENE